MFSRLLKILQRFNPFQLRSKVETLPEKLRRVDTELNEISLKQKEIREQVVLQPDPSYVDQLSPSQQKFVDEKTEKINLNNSWKEYAVLHPLLTQIEIYNTNALLAERRQFDYKQIDPTVIDTIRKSHQPPEIPEDLTIGFDQQRIKGEAERQEEIEILEMMREDLAKYSLVQIHKRRIEERIEKEKEEREKRIEQQYDSYMANANKCLLNNDFESALDQLVEASKIKPESEKKIQELKNAVASKKKQYISVKAKFQKLILKADNRTSNGDLNSAIQLYLEAKELEFNNSLCDRKIASTKTEIERKNRLRIELERRAIEEKEKREKYKEDADDILTYFQENGVKEFYHYTDSRNINSIIQNNGLFSLKELNRKEIEYVAGSETSELPTFIRLSYTQDHPLMYVSKNEGRISKAVVLNIEDKIVTLRKTRFSNVNAARCSTPPVAKFGEDIDFIKKNVKLDIVKKKRYYDLSDEEKPYYQAEILIKNHLPLHYITNL